MISYETINGTINISNDYMTKLIGHAVTSCFGVAGMVPCGGKQKILGLISKKEQLDRGIVVRGGIDGIDIELHIVVSYGMNLSAIAKSIVHKVKYTVAEATGITVNKVTVKVDGIKE